MKHTKRQDRDCLKAGDGIRTHDNHVGNVVLYQLSYTRNRHSGPSVRSEPIGPAAKRVGRKPRDYRGQAGCRKITLWVSAVFWGTWQDKLESLPAALGLWPERMASVDIRFVIISPEAKKGSFPVTLPLLIGRGEEAKFRIQHDRVSRSHCEFFAQDGVVFVRDLGSTNGTFLGKKLIPTSTKTPVPPKSIVRVGNVAFRVEYAGQPSVSTPVQRKADESDNATTSFIPLDEPLADAACEDDIGDFDSFSLEPVLESDPEVSDALEVIVVEPEVVAEAEAVEAPLVEEVALVEEIILVKELTEPEKIAPAKAPAKAPEKAPEKFDLSFEGLADTSAISTGTVEIDIGDGAMDPKVLLASSDDPAFDFLAADDVAGKAAAVDDVAWLPPQADTPVDAPDDDKLGDFFKGLQELD